MLVVVFAVCAIPFIGSYAVFRFWTPQARMNYGELVEPQPLAASGLRRLDGTPFDTLELRGRWVLTQVDAADCAEQCRLKLYYMRQVRLAQGRNADRVERLWLVSDAAKVDEELLQGHAGMHVVRAREETLLRAFPARDSVREHIYLIDPLGNLMLRFPARPDPSRMKKDLERLLKVSRVG